MHKSKALGLAVVAVLLTAGCAAQQPAPTVTVQAQPSPAVTVTPTPSPRTTDTPIDALEAWTICKAYRDHFEATGSPRTNHQTYSPGLVTGAGGKFTVAYKGKFNELGPGKYCVVSGTLGDPVIGNE